MRILTVPVVVVGAALSVPLVGKVVGVMYGMLHPERSNQHVVIGRSVLMETPPLPPRRDDDQDIRLFGLRLDAIRATVERERRKASSLVDEIVREVRDEPLPFLPEPDGSGSE